MAKDLFPSTNPLTPPLTEEVWLSWLRLLRSRRVGISTFYRLIEEHGSADAALSVLPEIAQAAGVSQYSVCSMEAAEKEWRAAHQAGAVPLAYGGEGYPRALMEISDAPPILWCIGDLSLLSKPSVAIVGARNASSLGTRMARRLASELGAEGLVITSGLARGVDTSAHLAALETGTIAVVAGGVDVVYPAENAVLAQEIGEKGLIVSEQPISTVPQARHFPARNRLISGLSRAVIVTEAAARSGSLITARNAAEQGRDVLAVPGHPFDARATGCNMLIRDGATLIRGPDDVMEVLQSLCFGDASTSDEQDIPCREAPAERSVKPAQDSDAKSETYLRDVPRLHAAILSRLGPSPTLEDDLIRDLNSLAHVVSPEVTTLEMEGKIRRDAGGLLIRVD